jgi:GTP:adenosylcobinamide-phosphate guanylyltransferase
MDAVVTAGGIPKPDELLYPYTLGKPKALLEIAGKPMVQWVLDALSGAKLVDRVVVMGLDACVGLLCTNNVLFGIQKVQEQNPTAQHVLLVSSDIPGIKSEMVDWVISNAMQTDDDLYYHLISQDVMEKRYPDSKRTYTKLKDAVVCGGDMNIVATRTATKNSEIWEKLIEARKNPVKQASILGVDTLFLLALRAVTVEGAVKQVAKKLHLTGRAVMCPFAEVGMDVDKPRQLELLRADLGKAGVRD